MQGDFIIMNRDIIFQENTRTFLIFVFQTFNNFVLTYRYFIIINKKKKNNNKT